jgi:serine/threonine protein kinase
LTFFPKIRSNTPGALNLQVGAEPSPGYRLKRVRGRGGFAEVWECDAPNGEQVALKFMPSSNAATTAREIRTLQSFLVMDHPHLIKHNAVWSLPGYIVINMELAEATLLDLMLVYQNELGQQLEPAMLGLYMWQVADALDFLNARKHVLDGRRVGFQHGDVKPSNILLVGDVAKLTDHGLATATHGTRTPCPQQGTPAYAAPEAFIGYYSEQSDQYSLAVTYFVLRTGLLPFPPTPSDPSVSYIRPLPDLSPLPEPERPVLQRALSAVPTSRFPSCKEFVAAVLRTQKLKATREDDTGPWKVVKDDSPPPRPPSNPNISIGGGPSSGMFRRKDVT